MNCLTCNAETGGIKKWCNDSCKQRYYRNEKKNRNAEERENRNDEENRLRSVEVEGEAPNCRSAREYREFQKNWIKKSCDKFSADNVTGTCDKCRQPYLKHHEGRYEVYHSEVL